MMKNILVLTLSLLVSAPALAQEFGALVGVHQVDADTDTVNGSIDGKFNFKAGLAVGFDLTETGKFRTGFIYNQRHFEQSIGATDFEYNFDYFDVPALYQHKFGEMFSAFGGLVVAVNVNDDVEASAGTAADPDIETLLPLLQAGVNLMFSDMIGFDFYYERGVGSFARDLETYNSFGANFLYWF